MGPVSRQDLENLFDKFVNLHLYYQWIRQEKISKGRMIISSNYKELFRNATTEDKLILFQVLLDAKEDMTVNLTLALLKTIHKELCRNQNRDRLAYKYYAEAIESLRYEMPDAFRQVIDAWKVDHIVEDVEWLSDGVIK